MAALSLLSVAVIVLSYAALTRVSSGNHEAIPTRAGSPTGFSEPSPVEPATQASGGVTDEETAPVRESEENGLAAPNRLLLAVTESVLVRATVGTCVSPGTFETSSDGGETWDESEAFGESGATQVLRLLVGSASSILVVANDQECAPRLFGTDAQGNAWYQAGSAGMAWYVNPSTRGEMGTPDGVRDTPCDALSLAAVGPRAALLCADSSVVISSDRGATWSEPIEIPTAVAINVTDSDDFILALANHDGCRGIRTATIRDDVLSAPSGCLEVDLAVDGTPVGDLAVARKEDVDFVWVGDSLVSSSSGGADWASR